MAKVHGVAGEWARVQGTVVGLWPLFLGVFVAGASLALFHYSALLGATFEVSALVYIIWSLMVGLRRVESFFKGARGEEKVSGILASLPDACHVFNDFTAGGKHVDHVVAGPCGVFAVETKFWQGHVTIEEGRVLLDGQLPDRDPIAQAEREAKSVRNALAATGWKGDVTPVLTFASDSFADRRTDLHGTIVINSNELQSALKTGRVVMSSAELDRLISLMESNL